MIQYMIKRIVIGVLSLFVLVGITFFLTRAIPGSPFESSNVSGEVLEMMENEYGLNDPVIVQYGTYLLHVIQGDFGYSYENPSQSVTSIIAEFLPVTIMTGGLALLLAIVTGVSFGIWMVVFETKNHSTSFVFRDHFRNRDTEFCTSSSVNFCIWSKISLASGCWGGPNGNLIFFRFVLLQFIRLLLFAE